MNRENMTAFILKYYRSCYDNEDLEMLENYLERLPDSEFTDEYDEIYYELLTPPEPSGLDPLGIFEIHPN